MLDNLNGSGLSESEVVAKMQAARSGEDQTSEPIESTDETVEEAEAESIAEQEQEVADDAGEYESEEVEEELDASELYTVKVDGQEREVSLDDLLNNFSKGEDYTKKTMKIADDRKAFEAESAQLKQIVEVERQKFAEATQQLQHLIGEQEKDSEYWADLRATDPSEYLAQKEALDAKKAKLAEAQQQQQEERARAFSDQRNKCSQALLDSVEEWSNEEVRNKDLNQMGQYLQDMGISNDEVNLISDPRFFLIARDAMRFRNVEKVGDVTKKQVKQAPKTVKSKRPVKRVKQVTDDARSKLRASGGKDMDSVVALMKAKRNK